MPAFQKATTKQLAISAWQARWHAADRRMQAFLALPSPPTGKFPPVIAGAVGGGGSHTASATLIRLITGHVFIGSYTARFHPRKPTHCPDCGARPQTVLHQCPRYAYARATFLTPAAPDFPYPRYLEPRKAEALIRFLDVTKACFRPHEPG